MWRNDRSKFNRTSVFRPIGQIGSILDGESLFLSQLGDVPFIIASNLRQFIVYEARSLRVVFISLPLQHRIKHISAKFEDTCLVLSDNSLHSFQKYDNRPIHTEHKSEILGICHLDDTLVSYSTNEVITYSKETTNDGNRSIKWVVKKVICLNEPIVVTHVVPLAGFKDKIILGSLTGELHLLNAKTGKKICTFPSKAGIDCNNDSLGISTVVQSHPDTPSILGIGYKCGYVAIVDINHDKKLGGFQLSKDNGIPCSMVFADSVEDKTTDGSKGKPVLVVGTNTGNLVVFDLSNFCIISIIESAHCGPVKFLLFVENSKSIVSSGNDNSIIIWAMDSDKSLLRELKNRRGFVGKINLIIPYDNTELDMIVCSNFNGFGYVGKASTIQQQQSTNFSSKIAKTRPKEITAISTSYQRHYDWPNIVTCHTNMHKALVWSGYGKSLSEGVLKVPNMNAVATAVCVTKCGNYAILGYENGEMHSFILQSCNHDMEFLFKDRNGVTHKAHSSKVISIFLTGGTKIHSVCDSKNDRTIRTWDITNMKIEAQYDPDLPIGCNIYAAQSGNILLSLACSDGKIYICDVVGKQIVRVLSYDHVKSMAFHPNGTWFIASSADSTMVVYDIMAACYVDYIKFSGTILDINIDSSGSFLYVSNEEHPGVVLQYSNKYAFELFPKAILYKDIPKVPLDIDAVVTETVVEPSDSEDTEVQIHYKSKDEPLEHGLMTLSGMSSSKVQTILFLDEIKDKSKPVEQEKANNDLPFFIPTTYKDGQLVFLEPEENKSEYLNQTQPKESLLKSTKKQNDLEKILLSNSQTKNQDVMKYLLGQTPSSVHLSLAVLGDDDKEQTLIEMLKFFEDQVHNRAYYDAVQVFFNIFLKFHGEDLAKIEDSEVIRTLKGLENKLVADSMDIQNKFDKITCFIKLFTHLQME